MANLFRMDLYRMRKAKAFWVYLILAFAMAAAMTPLGRLMILLSGLMGETAPTMPASVGLSKIIADPFPMVNPMLAMLSICVFFYADVENGYIKNIAGQVPRKGLTVFSKFLASIPHNLLFMAAGVVGNLIGTILFQQITLDAGLVDSLLVFLLKLLLMQSICSILLLVTSSFQNKSLGMILAVLMGMGLLSLVYMGLDSALGQLIPGKAFQIGDYMPDQLLTKDRPDTLITLAVSAVTLLIFLTTAIRVFDKKDVK